MKECSKPHDPSPQRNARSMSHFIARSRMAVLTPVLSLAKNWPYFDRSLKAAGVFSGVARHHCINL